MGTPNYNFTYINGAKNINIPSDTKKFLDEIDSKMYQNATNLGNNIAGLNNDITGLNNDIASLNNDIASLNNDVTGLGNDIQNISISKLKNSKIVCIGDSYLEGYTPDGIVTSWGNILKTKLSADVSISALGGTGFKNPINNVTFNELITNIANSLGKTECENVNYVIIGGGYNDRGYTYSEVFSAADKCASNAKQRFPNATIAVFPMLFGNKGYSSGYANVTNAIQAAFMGCLVFPNCWTWNYSKSNNIASDGVHPNLKGQTVIADSIITSLSGGDATIYVEDFSYSPVFVTRILDSVIIRCNGASGSEGKVLATMDESLSCNFALNTGIATRDGSYQTSYYQVSGNKVSIFSGRVDANGYFNIVTTLG